MQEKYGFVYIWYDRKHKRFYIGCHWGLEDDGYICSSSWMKKAYKIRAYDFKRKILSRIYTNRLDMLSEEYRWLSKIKTEELGKKYYNMHNHHFNHWTSDATKFEEIAKKISAKTKGNITAKDADGNIIITNKDDPLWISGELIGVTTGHVQTEEANKKRSVSHKGKVHSAEMRQKMQKVMTGKSPWNAGKTLSEDQIRKKMETSSRNKALGITKYGKPIVEKAGRKLTKEQKQQKKETTARNKVLGITKRSKLP